MNKIPMTASGYEDIQNELKKLINVDRPNIIAAIAEARSHGDLSENAEYQYAKESQSLIEGKIADLENAIGRAEVIDVKSIASDEIAETTNPLYRAFITLFVLPNLTKNVPRIDVNIHAPPIVSG